MHENALYNAVKTPKLLVLLSLTLSLLMACTQKQSTSKNVFSYNEATGIATLDPAFAKNQSIMWAVHQIYNTLVEIDSNLNIVPSLAKAWEVSDDRKTYRFHLRTNVYFTSDEAFKGRAGRKLVAADVAYSLGRIIDKTVASSGAWIFNNRVDSVTPFVVINDSTFELRLQRPFHPIMGILSTQYCSVVPKEVVEKYGKDFRRHPCGTGPFVLKSWDEGEAMILHKNKNYWEVDSAGDRLPYIDAVKINFFDNKAPSFYSLDKANSVL
jgi:peptide/nickel transport system substrate-binding protein